MDIWHYHPEDGSLLGQGKADPDPMQAGHWLLPAWSTTIAPPAVGPDERAHFDGGAWIVVPVSDGA